MKKEYIKPEMQVYEMETLQLIAVSQGDPEIYGDFPDDDNDDIL